jgi:hypothetical protein
MVDDVIQITHAGTTNVSGYDIFQLAIADGSNSYGCNTGTFLFEWNVVAHSISACVFYSNRWLSSARVGGGIIYDIETPYLVGSSNVGFPRNWSPPKRPDFYTYAFSNVMICQIDTSTSHSYRVFANIYKKEI